MSEKDPNGHVNFATFGIEAVKDQRRARNLITKTKPMDSYTTTLAWREYYETHFGIFNHDAPDAVKYSPLALVALHPKEDTYSYSLLHRFLWRFRQYRIQANWGYSLTEFLNLPWYYTEDIFRIEQKAIQEELRINEQRRQQETAQLQADEHAMQQRNGGQR